MGETETSVERQQSVTRMLGQYRLADVIGSGGFGIVYRATDMELSREVAIKIPRPEVLVDNEKRKRFNLEAEMASRLSHPGIVTIFEAKLSSPIPYIVSALCLGTDLAQWLIAQTEPPGCQDSIRLIQKIAASLEYSHSEGVFHRDIKPSNIMLVADEESHDLASKLLSHFEPKITDFGLGKFAHESMIDTSSSLVIGTPHYMAPEQISGDRNSEPGAADVYSLGVLLFELLTLELPFDGSTHFEVLNSIKEDCPKRLRKINSKIPKSIANVCAKCLEKNPSLRYQSLGELAADLSSCLEGRTVKPVGRLSMQRLAHFASDEQRIADAGWFAIWSQIAVCLWVNGFWLIIGGISLGTNQNVARSELATTLFEVVGQ